MSDLSRSHNPRKLISIWENEVSVVVPVTKFNGVCGYCMKPGHMEQDCRHKLYDQNKTVQSGTRRVTPKSALPVVSCRGHPRRSYVRPNIQSWNPATGCGA
jgi:hypothetical protein